jgi:hypothetical protein
MDGYSGGEKKSGGECDRRREEHNEWPKGEEKGTQKEQKKKKNDGSEPEGWLLQNYKLELCGAISSLSRRPFSE